MTENTAARTLRLRLTAEGLITDIDRPTRLVGSLGEPTGPITSSPAGTKKPDPPPAPVVAAGGVNADVSDS